MGNDLGRHWPPEVVCHPSTRALAYVLFPLVAAVPAFLLAVAMVVARRSGASSQTSRVRRCWEMRWGRPGEFKNGGPDAEAAHWADAGTTAAATATAGRPRPAAARARREPSERGEAREAP